MHNQYMPGRHSSVNTQIVQSAAEKPDGLLCYFILKTVRFFFVKLCI
jgi:hypothetical protein